MPIDLIIFIVELENPGEFHQFRR